MSFEDYMTTSILRPKPAAQQEPKLPDQIADAWAAVLIDKGRMTCAGGTAIGHWPVASCRVELGVEIE